MKFGSALKEVRKMKKISQGELAKKLEISQTYLSLLEKNVKQPSFELLERISDSLGLPVYYFMFKGLEIDKDIAENKQEIYKQISPIIESMIEKFFISDDKETSEK